MKQFPSFRLIHTFLNTCGYPGRLPLRFPRACIFCLLKPKSILPSPSRSRKSPHFACITCLPKCTIIYIIGGLSVWSCDMACVMGIQPPKCGDEIPKVRGRDPQTTDSCYPCVRLAAAQYRYDFVEQVVQPGWMRRCRNPLFHLSHFRPHQPLIVGRNSSTIHQKRR
jgi:hypothetical protein